MLRQWAILAFFGEKRCYGSLPRLRDATVISLRSLSWRGMGASMLKILCVISFLAFCGSYAAAASGPGQDPEEERIDLLKRYFGFDGEEPTQANILKTILAPLPPAGGDRPRENSMKIHAALALAQPSPQMIRALFTCLNDDEKSRLFPSYITALHRMIGNRDQYVQNFAARYFNEKNANFPLSQKLSLLKSLLRNHQSGLKLEFPRKLLAAAFLAPRPDGLRPLASEILVLLRDKDVMLADISGLYSHRQIYDEVMEEIEHIRASLSSYLAMDE